MAVIVNYKVDKEQYDNSGFTQRVMMATTEHRHGDESLLHMRVGKKFRHIVGRWIEYGLEIDIDGIDNEHFYLSRSGQNTRTPISRSEYEMKLKSFHMDDTVTSEEQIGEYRYIDGQNQTEIACITVRTEDEMTMAEVEFRDSEHYKNFVRPDWMRCI